MPICKSHPCFKSCSCYCSVHFIMPVTVVPTGVWAHLCICIYIRQLGTTVGEGPHMNYMSIRIWVLPWLLTLDTKMTCVLNGVITSNPNISFGKVFCMIFCSIHLWWHCILLPVPLNLSWKLGMYRFCQCYQLWKGERGSICSLGCSGRRLLRNVYVHIRGRGGREWGC